MISQWKKNFGGRFVQSYHCSSKHCSASQWFEAPSLKKYLNQDRMYLAQAFRTQLAEAGVVVLTGAVAAAVAIAAAAGAAEAAAAAAAAAAADTAADAAAAAAAAAAAVAVATKMKNPHHDDQDSRLCNAST